MLNGSIDLFQRDTKEMLLSVKAPAQVGNRYDPVANVGTVRNQGIEITLDHQNRIGKLNYTLSGNISFIKNELTSLNGGDRVYGDRAISDKGYGLYTFWGYQYDGIYQSDAEALQHLNKYTASTIPYHEIEIPMTTLKERGLLYSAGMGEKNVFWFLAGGVAGTTVDLDAVFIYKK